MVPRSKTPSDCRGGVDDARAGGCRTAKMMMGTPGQAPSAADDSVRPEEADDAPGLDAPLPDVKEKSGPFVDYARLC